MKKLILGLVVAFVAVTLYFGNELNAANYRHQHLNFGGVKYDVVSKDKTSAVLKYKGNYKIFTFNSFFNTKEHKNFDKVNGNYAMYQMPLELYRGYRVALEMPKKYDSFCSRHGLKLVSKMSSSTIACSYGMNPKFMFFGEYSNTKLIKSLKRLKNQKSVEKTTWNNKRWSFYKIYGTSMQPIYDVKNQENTIEKIKNYIYNYIPCKYSSKKGNTCNVVRKLENDKSFNWLNLWALREGESNFYEHSKDVDYYGEGSTDSLCKEGNIDKCHLPGRSLSPEVRLATLSSKLNYAVDKSNSYGKNIQLGQQNRFDKLIDGNAFKWYY